MKRCIVFFLRPDCDVLQVCILSSRHILCLVVKLSVMSVHEQRHGPNAIFKTDEISSVT